MYALTSHKLHVSLRSVDHNCCAVESNSQGPDCIVGNGGHVRKSPRESLVCFLLILVIELFCTL